MSDPETMEKGTAQNLKEKRPRPPFHSQLSAPITSWELPCLELKTSHAFLLSFISTEFTHWQWTETLVSPAQGGILSIKTLKSGQGLVQKMGQACDKDCGKLSRK